MNRDRSRFLHETVLKANTSSSVSFQGRMMAPFSPRLGAHRDWHFVKLAISFAAGALVCSLFLPRQSSFPRPFHAARVEFAPSDSAIEDSIFLGEASGDVAPKRKSDYVYKTVEYQGLYDKTWTQGGYPSQSCWGCRFTPDLVAKLGFHTVLDAGTGNGFLIRLMRKYNKSAWGIELSKAVLEQECPDLLKHGYVEAGVLTNLPYEDNSFDLVHSADVLEHIHPDEADRVISELVRVSRRHLFFSISLKGHTKLTAENNNEANRHTMLRPRTWWEQKFREHGAVVNKELLLAMQQKDASYSRTEMSDCRWEGDRNDGGLYEVCVVDNTWLVGRAEQANVRKDRCITPANMDLEPWIFSFRKIR